MVPLNRIGSQGLVVFPQSMTFFNHFKLTCPAQFGPKMAWLGATNHPVFEIPARVVDKVALQLRLPAEQARLRGPSSFVFIRVDSWLKNL
jgi:hypothetical protein